MLQNDFYPPDPQLARKETAKRIQALEKFIPRIQKSVTSITVTGSMASGQNYAVTEKSDLDLQLSITPQSVLQLKDTGVFSHEAIKKPLQTYLDHKIRQFSLSVEIDGIPHECHFWDQEAMIDAMEMKIQMINRIRTNNSSPAIDYAFSFDGSQNEYNCTTQEADGIYISVLPSYRYVNDLIYLSRPVTNWLNTPYIIFGSEFLEDHINNTWRKVIDALVKESQGMVDLSKRNVLNTLPSKFKASPEAKNKILERTKAELENLRVPYTM